jgi:uncharacterized protein (DUF885 family)
MHMVHWFRQRAEPKPDNSCDLPAFHNAVLEYGSVPLVVFDENFHLLIAKQ